MKKTILVSIPMTIKKNPKLHLSDDISLPVSDRKVVFVINAFLEKTMTQTDELKVLLLMKKSPVSEHEKWAQCFIDELNAVNASIGAKIEYKKIESEFSEKGFVHEALLTDIINEIEVGSHLISDITYGPKDIPFVMFAALNFAEKFLQCEIDNILYSQVDFSDKRTINAKICDMSPLYYLNSAANVINCTDPEKAKAMLKTLLSI